MPIYEYECPACEKVFEVQQRISDEPLKVCPECDGKVKKLVSVSSFQLKGSGWYSDGYSGPSNGDAKKAPAPDAAPAKKETPSTPCKAGEGGCKNCPAATA